MDQSRPAVSQSPLRMHNLNNNASSSNNFSQKQLGSLPNQGRNNGKGSSPIRESLIKNTGVFILVNGNNNAGNQGASGGSPNAPMIQNQPSQHQLNNYGPNTDLNNLGTVSPQKRERNADRADFDYVDRQRGGKDLTRVNQSHEKDVLDNFMSLPKQQQMQIQMLTEQQQMAYITQHRAETSGVHLQKNANQFNQSNFRGMPPSSGGTGAKIGFNSLNQNQQQSSQPILHTTNKYGVGPSQTIQAHQSQMPQFSAIVTANGDSGSFTLPRNSPSLTLNQDNQRHHTLSNSPNKGEAIKNKRVFIENTVDSILQSKSSKANSFMTKPVGITSGTGTTDIHPKIHSVSPRGNVGSSIVGLPNIVVGQAQPSGAPIHITKQNRSGGQSPQKEHAPPAGGNSRIPQRVIDANRQVDDFLAETDKMGI